MKTHQIVCLFFGLIVGSAAADYGGGDGSSDFPYLICEPAHLLALGDNSHHWNKHFKVTADIDMEGAAFKTIGGLNHPDVFTGTFDGNGHFISSLSDTMFTRLDFGTIKNVRLENATATGWGIGLLVNFVNAGGTVDNCFVRGSILTEGYDSGGLVGSVSSSIIQNSGSDVVVTGGENSQRLGGLVGRLESGTIANCYSTSTVTAGSVGIAIGGLVGRMDSGTIENSFTAASVTGAKYIGGIVGELFVNTSFVGTISNCYSMSDVTLRTGKYGSEAAGGIGGSVWGYGVTIANCQSSGTITGCDGSKTLGGMIGSLHWGASLTNSGSSAQVTGGLGSTQMGGLVGWQVAAASVSRCYSTGRVAAEASGSIDIGGLVGALLEDSTITDSYSSSSVAGAKNSSLHRMGGLVGRMDSHLSTRVDRCFSVGQVDGQGVCIGGLVGSQQTGSVVAVSFWDTETSGQTQSAGGSGVMGLSTAEMQNQNYFSYSGWDFDDQWTMFEYPGLAWQPEVGVSGNFSVTIPRGADAVIEFNVSGLTNTAIDWLLEGHEDCLWITGASPSTGSSTGPADVTLVRVAVDSDGLTAGRYVHQLYLTANGKSLTVPLLLNVYNPVALESYMVLASHWATDNCDFGQPCKTADWYADGRIDIRDLIQLADSWLGEQIVSVSATFEEDFESGNFSSPNWEHSGNAEWEIVDSGAYEGTYAARSGQIDAFQNSTVEITLDLTGWGINSIGFAVKLSSLSSFHSLEFSIDGEKKDEFSGVWNDYSFKTYPVTPGVRTFKWNYRKGPGTAAGEDCAWIDAIRIFAL